MRTTACALLVVAAVAAPATAAPKPKPMAGTYEVNLPTPYVVDGKTTCADAVEGRSKNTREFTFPRQGGWSVSLSDFVGDWELEIYDGDRLVIHVDGDPSLGAEKRTVLLKRILADHRYSVVVCNALGTPTATVSWRFSPAR